MRREKPIFNRHPTAADGHAAGDQAEEFGKFAAGDVFRFDAFDGKIHFGRSFFREWAVRVHSLSTTSSVAPFGIMILTFVFTRCWPKRNVFTGGLFGRFRWICSRVPKKSAPLGQTVAHMGFLPALVRS